jgi:hypothetical protein
VVKLPGLYFVVCFNARGILRELAKSEILWASRDLNP